MFFINIIIIRFSNCSSSFSFKLSYDIFDLHLSNKVIFNIFRERGANLGSQGEMVLLGKTVCQGYLGNRWAYRRPWHWWRNMGVNFIIICFVCLFLFVVYLTILCPVFVIFIISVLYLSLFCRVLLDPLALQDLKESKVTAAHQDRCVYLRMCASPCVDLHVMWALIGTMLLIFILSSFFYFHRVLQSVVGPPGKKGEPVSCCHGYLIWNTVKINLSHLHDR